MNWFQSILLALLTAALTLVGGGLVMNACVKWYNVSSFEGKSGYAVIGVALLSGIVGLILGVVVARLVAAGANPGFIKGLGFAWLTVLVIAGAAAGLARMLADVPPTIGGQELTLEVEIKLPVTVTDSPANSNGPSLFNLGSSVNHTQRASRVGELDLAASRQESGRWIVPASVYVFTSRGLRSLDIQINGGERFGFIVPLPGRPGKAFEAWSEWGPQPPASQPPWPDTKPSYRFRVQRIQPPPPAPDPDLEEAKQFEALKPDAPLEDWLAFMNHDSAEARVLAVMTVVERRSAELAGLIRSTNNAARESALSAVPRLSTVSPEVSEAVQAEGRAIASELRRFNEMKSDDPRFYDVQSDLCSRFNYWKQAWWAIHQRLGLDGRPPVQEIFDLAQVRAKETSMDEIVINARVILDALKPASEKAP